MTTKCALMPVLTPAVYWQWVWLVNDREIQVMCWQSLYMKYNQIMTDKRLFTISSLQNIWNIFNPQFHTSWTNERGPHCTWFALVYRLLNLRFVISCAWDSRCLAGVHQILIIKVTPVIPFISKVKADGRYLWGWNIFALSAVVWCGGRAFRTNWAVGLDLASIHLIILTHTDRNSWVCPHCRTQTKQYSFIEL